MTTAHDYVAEKRHARLTPGRSLQILRELQELTQSELARRTGIAQSAISAFESGSQEMGLKRVTVLAAALGVHPAVIAFPEHHSGTQRAAAPATAPFAAAPATAPARKAAMKRPAKRRTG